MNTAVHPFAVVDATDADAVDVASASLRSLGAAVIRNAVPLDVIDRLRDAMLAELDLAAATPAALDVPGHVQHNPPPRGEHIYPEIIANPSALAVASSILGRGFQVTLYTGNTMLGGTTQQQPLHWDEPQLWANLPEAAPAHSLTVNIPLVDVTEENGALEAWPGTHLDTRSGGRALKNLEVPPEWQADYAPARIPVEGGSLLLRDARLWHRGTTNSTTEPRPMVAVVYAAWWFKPLPIDFYSDAQPVIEATGLRLTPRYRDEFDHHVWPPNWDMTPA